jgi:DNA-binding response OmpR family regulator
MSKKKTILIVEDQPSFLDAFRRRFEGEGYNIIVAQDGLIGLKMSLEHKPDLIITDIVMPNMDGMTMLEKIREDEWGANVPIIILSVLDSYQQVAKALSGQVYDYFAKPDINFNDLVKKVKERLKEKG